MRVGLHREGGNDGCLIPVKHRQMRLIQPFFPLSQGVPRLDQKILPAIIPVIMHGLASNGRSLLGSPQN